MQTNTSSQTEAVLNHHLQSIGEGNMDAILSDYDNSSVVLTQNGTVQGVDNIREVFNNFMSLPKEVFESFELVRSDISGEVAYITWSMAPAIPLGTDTFVVRDGKIAVQSFAFYKNGS